MLISEDDCKEAIVALASKQRQKLARDWLPPLSEEDIAKAIDVSNWEIRDTELEDSITTRTFNCEPFDDQMRGYTYDDGEKIYLVEVQGEWK